MKLDEELKVTIEETEEMEMEEVKDIPYTLNTLQSNSASVITDKINGKIKAIIILTNKPIDIKICFDEIPEIDLINVLQFNGSNLSYIPIKTDSFSKELDRYNYGSEEWYLNNKLRIELNGQTETEVRIIIRYC